MVATNYRRFPEALICQLELALQGFENTMQNLRGAALACWQRHTMQSAFNKRLTRIQTTKKLWHAARLPAMTWWHQASLLTKEPQGAAAHQ